MQVAPVLTGKPRPAAFTLLEVLVAAFLVSLLLTILVRVASLSYRIGHEEIERSGLEAKALLTARKLELDLLGTAPSGVTLCTAGDRLMVHPIDRLSPTGQILFAPRLVLWSQGEATLQGQKANWLIRSEITDHPKLLASTDGGPLRLSPNDLAGLPLGAGQRQTMMFAGVTKFAVANPPGVVCPQVGAALTFTLEMDLDIATTRRTIRLERTVQLRTSGGI